MITFEQALSEYLTAKSRLSKFTLKNYTYYLGRFHKDTPAWPPTEEDINRYLTTCEEQGLSKASVRSSYNSLRAFFFWLKKTKRIDSNPMVDIIPPPDYERRSRSPKTTDVAQFFDYLEKRASSAVMAGISWGNYMAIRDLAVFSLMYDTGLRIREASYIKIDDIDFEQGIVYVQAAKGGKPREVTIGRNTRGDLKLLIKSREALGIPNDLPWLFVKKRGGWCRAGKQAIRKRLQTVCHRAGVPYFTPHQMRHAYALHSLRNGSSLSDVSQQLGHSRVSITDTYTKAPAAERVEMHLKSSPRDHIGGVV